MRKSSRFKLLITLGPVSFRNVFSP